MTDTSYLYQYFKDNSTNDNKNIVPVVKEKTNCNTTNTIVNVKSEDNKDE